jgi:hypothetical protein
MWKPTLPGLSSTCLGTSQVLVAGFSQSDISNMFVFTEYLINTLLCEGVDLFWDDPLDFLARIVVVLLAWLGWGWWFRHLISIHFDIGGMDWFGFIDSFFFVCITTYLLFIHRLEQLAALFVCLAILLLALPFACIIATPIFYIVILLYGSFLKASDGLRWVLSWRYRQDAFEPVSRDVLEPAPESEYGSDSESNGGFDHVYVSPCLSSCESHTSRFCAVCRSVIKNSHLLCGPERGSCSSDERDGKYSYHSRADLLESAKSCHLCSSVLRSVKLFQEFSLPELPLQYGTMATSSPDLTNDKLAMKLRLEISQHSQTKRPMIQVQGESISESVPLIVEEEYGRKLQPKYDLWYAY